VASAVPLPSAAVDLLNSTQLAHVITINPDGTPHVTVVWVETDGHTILFGAQAHRRKITNLARDPRVQVSMDSPNANSVGMRYHLLVHEHAELETTGYADLMDRLARRYSGAPRFFMSLRGGEVDFRQVRITPYRIGGYGPWTGHPSG
jgi:PPOX class probable F420-dependent enzyme